MAREMRELIADMVMRDRWMDGWMAPELSEKLWTFKEFVFLNFTRRTCSAPEQPPNKGPYCLEWIIVYNC